MGDSKKILFYGMGAIGTSIYAWLKPKYSELFAYDLKPNLKILQERGVMCKLQGDDKYETANVNIVENLSDVKDIDIVFLSVKNFSMEQAAKELKEIYGDKPIIVSFANGIYNQEILPKYFSKVVYTVVSYNALLEEVGKVIAADRGPIFLGILDKNLEQELQLINKILNLGVEASICRKFQDVVYSKLTINLTNALDTILGKGVKSLDDMDDIGLYARLLTRNMWEGIRIIKKAGYKEVKLKSFPPFMLTWLGTWAPMFLTLPRFKKKMRCVLTPSMAQDVILKKMSSNELESLTGIIVDLADKVGMDAPYAKTMLKIGKKFGPDFKPLTCKELDEEIKKTKKELEDGKKRK